MKKFISVLLSICMVFSCVSFAAPVMVNVEISTYESVETEINAEHIAKVSSESVTVSFVGDIATEFASIQANVGDTLDLSDYLDVEISDSAKAEHKRFNGWMPDGAESLLTTDTVKVTDDDGDGEMYLVALVNHDFNMALEANRSMFQGTADRATPSVGSNGKTLYVSANATLPSVCVVNGVNGVDFQIDTTEYKGATIYYGNGPLSSTRYVYGIGVNTIDNQSTTKWQSEPDFTMPGQLPGYLVDAATFNSKCITKVYDDNGDVIYGGLSTTLENSYEPYPGEVCTYLTNEWTDTVYGLAVPFIYGATDFEIRYIRFVPTVEDGVKPGLNLWTGTTEAYDFENADENALLSKNWQVTYETRATNDNENNTAARIRSGWGEFSKEIPFVEKDRPVKVSFDYTSGTTIRVVMNSTSGTADDDGEIPLNKNTLITINDGSLDAWKHTSSVLYGSTDYPVQGIYHTNSSDIEVIYFFSESAGEGKNVYIDNISIVPGYKINYDANGGSGYVEPDYFMEGTYSDLDNGASLTNEGKAFKGWSLTKNGNVVTKVTGIPGSDVTLYAVWEEVNDIATTVSITAPAAGATAQTTVEGTGFTGSIAWYPALTDGKFVNGTAYTATVTLTVAEGYTAAGVAENGYTVAGATVTNAAGAATFKATFPATEAAKAKPGLNVWTGTTEVYNFEGKTANDFYLFNNASLGTDGQNSYIEFGGSASHFTLKNAVPVVDKDRPVKVTLKAQVDTAEAKSIMFVRNRMNAARPYLALIYTSMPTAWTTYTSTFKGTDLDATGATSVFTDDTQDIRQLVLISESDCSNNKMRIDDVSIVPAYKLTYDVNGGNGSVDSVYFFDAYTTLDNGASLSNGTMKFKGWSLTQGGEVITSVTGVPGSDVTVYAVWEEVKDIATTVSITAPVAGETAQTTVTGTGFTGSIAWYPALTDGKFAYSTAYTATVALTVADGYTAENVAANSYTVAGATVANEAGAATFKATFPATEAAKAKPGLNVWTGTTEAYTFDGAVQSDFAAYGNAVLVEETDAYMNLAGSIPHFTLKNTYGVVEKDRPVKATFKVLNHSTAKDVRIIRNVTNNLNPVLSKHIIGAPGSWQTLSSEIIGSSQDVTNAVNGSYTDNTQDLKNLIILVANDCSTGNVYVDDVSFVPAYKLTYDLNGGSGSVDSVYFFDSYSTLDNGASLTSDKGEFAGWSLTPDGQIVTSVTGTPGSDITLYAVWVDYSAMDSFTYELTSNVPGVANGTMSFVAPTAAHTNAIVSLANDEGIMEDYTEFATVNFTNRVATYVVSGNRAFAMGATKLMVTFSGEGVENETVEYTIPEANRLNEETPLYKYFVVSDLHLGGSSTNNIDYFYMQWSNTDPTRTRALGGGSNNRKGDVFENDADFVIINGDLVNYGSYYRTDDSDSDGQPDGEVGESRYWDILDSYIENRLNNHNIPVFLTNGNHEFQKETGSEQNLAAFIPTRLNSAIMGQVNHIEENYGNDVVITKDETNPDALYYAADMYGAKYIFLSTPEMSEDKTGSSHTVSAKQLAFLDAQLYDGENSGKLVYVITHLPIADIANSADVEAILAKHSNAIVFESHTHNNLTLDTHYTVVGDITTSNTGALSYIEPKVNGSYVTSYNVGQFVEVYEDKVIIKGRKFADESQFIGNALYIVETPDEGEIKSVSIDGSLIKGETITVLVNGSEVADNANYTYEWIIAGETVSTEKSLTLTTSGEKVIVRVTAQDGSYASALSDVVSDYAPTSYNVSSIRTDAYMGIRFKSSVTTEQKAAVAQYGFIVSLETLLGENELNHNFEQYVEGLNYIAEGPDALDKVYEIENDNVFFTAVVYGVPEEKDAYMENFVVRPFTKLGDTYYYGAPIVRSVLSVAEALRDMNYPDLDDDAIETVKNILTICEVSTDPQVQE